MSLPLDLESAYRRHGRIVLRRAGALLGDRDGAREVLQEIFVSLLSDPSQFRGESSIVTYLYRATTNLCLNRLRDRRSRSRLLDEKVAPIVSGAAEPRAERLQAVRDLLARLPDDVARAVVFVYVDEMTLDEVAAVLGCSRRHVSNLLARARELAHRQARVA